MRVRPMPQLVLALFGAACWLGSAEVCTAEVVISEVFAYGPPASPDASYVELFNTGASPVSMEGWSLQVSDTGEGSWLAHGLSGSIDPGGFHLVRVGERGAGEPVPAADSVFSSPLAFLRAQRGVAALVADDRALFGCALLSPNLVDLVGWGGALCFEGAASASGTSNAGALERFDAGCRDTDSNIADLRLADPSPSNSASNAFLDVRAFAAPGGLVSVRAERSDHPCSAIGVLGGVSVDLSSLGLGVLELSDDGSGADPFADDGEWWGVVADAGVSPGEYTLAVSASDTDDQSLRLSCLLVVEPSPPANDTCADAPALGGLATPRTFVVDVSLAQSDFLQTTCGIDALIDRGVWYRVDPTGDGVVVVQERSGARVIAASTTCGSSVAHGCGEGGTVVLDVSRDEPAYVLVAPGSGQDVLDIRIEFLAAPENDSACDATPIGVGVPVLLDGRGATGDAGLSCAVNGNGGLEVPGGVWASIRAPGDGVLRISEQTDVPAVLGAYEGSCTVLVERVCGNDAMTVPVARDEQVRVLVAHGGEGAPAEPYRLLALLSPTPTNDSCSSATPVGDGGVGAFLDRVDVTAAGSDQTHACPAGNLLGRGVWYRFDALERLRVEVAQTNTLWQTEIAVLLGETGAPVCASGTPVLCGLFDRAGVVVGPGQTLLIGVGCVNTLDPGGRAELTVEIVATPIPGACCTGLVCSPSTAGQCASAGGVFFEGGECSDGVSTGISDESVPIIDTLDAPSGITQTSIELDAGGSVLGVEVAVDMEHLWVGDVRLELQSPAGTVAPLFNRPSNTPGCAFDVLGKRAEVDGVYTFTDGAGGSLHQYVIDNAFGAVVPAGDYLPTGCDGAPVSLAQAFAGDPVAGVWTLRFVDGDPGGPTGTLRGWSLEVARTEGSLCAGQVCPADLNADGDFSVGDILDYLGAWSAGSPEGDTNNDGNFSVGDILDFLTLWSSGCGGL